MLSSALWHQRDFAGTLAALDTSIQRYPNTTSELLALYGKVNLAINILDNRSLAQDAFQTLQARYPTHSLTLLADVLVNDGGSMSLVSKSTAWLSTPASLEKPLTYALEQNYPNPFNPSTMIKYQIPQSGHVLMRIFDVMGREVKTLLDQEMEAGYHQITFDASQLATGVYFCQLRSRGFLQTKKLLLVR